MAGIFENFGSSLVLTYKEFLAFLPFWAQNFINLFLISLIIVIYSIFIWKFYRWIAKKDLLKLNLKKYSTSENKFLAKSVAGFFYFLEYIIILPIVVFIWFCGFTIFLMLLTENMPLQTILIISATIIVAIRMTAYYKEDLAKDLAKLLPFTLLGVSITQLGGFNFENIITQIFAIPTFFNHIAIYLLFIMIIEFILRTLEVIFIASGLHDEEEVKSEEENSSE
jgi:hypothetical protein